MSKHHEDHPDYAAMGVFAGYGECEAAPKKKRFRRYYCREGCGNVVEEKDGLCPGCDAYRDHTGHF